MALNWGFWGSLANQAARGRAAWLAGTTQGEEDRAAREQRRRAEERASRMEERDAALDALRTEATNLEIDERRRRQRMGPTLTGRGGREFPDTEEGRQQLLDWNRQYLQNEDLPGSNPSNTDPYIAKRRAYDYWSQVAEDLVATHGTDAINVATRLDRPETREAYRSGQLTREMFQSALRRQQQGEFSRDPRQRVLRQFGQPMTPLEQVIFDQLVAGHTAAQILQMMRSAGQPPEAIRDAEMYLDPDF